MIHTPPVDASSKDRSPFYPGHPVPAESFIGRSVQVDRLLRRGAAQVAAGKPVTAFVEGEYGIGKSSLVAYAQRIADKDYGLHPIYVTLGGAKTLEDLIARLIESTLSSGAFESTRLDALRDWLGKYVGDQQLFGFRINFERLKADAPAFASPRGLLDFLAQGLERLSPSGVRGVFLVLDEINGIVADPGFAAFVKSVTDENSFRPAPVPLMLVLCGTDDKRREMIARHQSVDRVFEVVPVGPMDGHEVEQFYRETFARVSMHVEGSAMPLLYTFSAGLPKFMQMLGDSAFWIDRDGIVDVDDVISAVNATAEDVGRKFVDRQVYDALKSEKYQSILHEIGKRGPVEMAFLRKDVIDTLEDAQRKVFDNFLQRMQALNVIRKGERQGEYCFNVLMVRYYIYLYTQRRDGAFLHDSGAG